MYIIKRIEEDFAKENDTDWNDMKNKLNEANNNKKMSNNNNNETGNENTQDLSLLMFALKYGKYKVASSIVMYLHDDFNKFMKNSEIFRNIFLNCIQSDEDEQYLLVNAILKRISEILQVCKEFSQEHQKRFLRDISSCLNYMKGRKKTTYGSATIFHYLSYKGQKEIIENILSVAEKIKPLLENITEKKYKPKEKKNTLEKENTSLAAIFLKMYDNDENEYTPLCYAILGGNLSCVKLLADKGVNDSKLEIDYKTGVIAARVGSEQIIDYLYSKFNFKTKMVFMHETMKVHRITVVEKLLEEVKSDSDWCMIFTTLYFAVVSGSLEIVRNTLTKMKLRYKQQEVLQAKVNKYYCNQNTPLLIAVKLHPLNYAILDELLSYGADVWLHDDRGKSFFHYIPYETLKQLFFRSKICYEKYCFFKATENIDSEACQALFYRSSLYREKYCCFMAAKNNDHEFLTNYNINDIITWKSKSAKTIFHYAAKYKADDVLKYCLELLNGYKTYLSMKDMNGKTPLMLACEVGNLSSIKIFVGDNETNVGLAIPLVDEHGGTILQCLANNNSRESADILQYLNEKFPQHILKIANMQNLDGDTALHLAVKNKNSYVMRSLLYSNPNIYNNKELLPFHYVFHHNDQDFADEFMSLFDKSYSLVHTNLSLGVPILHYAARQKMTTFLKYLIENGADIFQENEEGNTVLHYLACLSVQKDSQPQIYIEMANIAINAYTTRAFQKKSKCIIFYGKHKIIFISKQQILFYLTRCVLNRDNCSVLNYSVRIGAVKYLQMLISPISHDELNDFDISVSEDEFKNHDYYNITFLTPKYSLKPIKVNFVGKSLLEEIVNSPQAYKFAKLFDEEPMKHLHKEYVSIYERIYLVFLLLHIFYMSCFTYLTLPNWQNSISYNNTHLYGRTDTINECFPLFFIWPVMLIVVKFFVKQRNFIIFKKIINGPIMIFRSLIESPVSNQKPNEKKHKSALGTAFNFVITLLLTFSYVILAFTFYIKFGYHSNNYFRLVMAVSTVLLTIIEIILVPLMWIIIQGKSAYIGSIAVALYFGSFCYFYYSQNALSDSTTKLNGTNLTMNEFQDSYLNSTAFSTSPSLEYFWLAIFVPIISLMSVLLITAWLMDKEMKQISGFIACLTYVVEKFLNWFGSIMFLSILISWYILYAISNENQNYILAICLLVGWTYSLNFVAAFRSMNLFGVILKKIIYEDMLRFILVYTFVVLGFSFALYTMSFNRFGFLDEKPTPLDVIYLAIQLSVGLGEGIIKIDAEDNNQIPTLWADVKIVHVMFIIAANVILLNIIIAMMSATYEYVQTEEMMKWRCNCFKQLLGIHTCILNKCMNLANWINKNKMKYIPIKMYINDNNKIKLTILKLSRSSFSFENISDTIED